MSKFPTRVISQEEDIVLSNNATNELNNIANELEKISRANASAIVAEDLCKVGNTITNATPVELFLVESTGRALAANVNIDSDILTTGLESYQGKQFSNESFSSFVVAMYRAIAAAIKKVWDSVTAFFISVFGSIPRMRFFIKRIRDKVDLAGDSYRWADRIDLGFAAEALSVNDKLPKYPIDIANRLDHLHDVLSFYLGEYMDTGVTVFKNTVYEMERFNEDEPSLTLNAISEEMLPLVQRNTPIGLKATRTIDSRFTAGSWYALDPLPGDKTMFARKERIPESITPLQRSEAIQAHTIQFLRTKVNSSVVSDRTGSIVTPRVEDLNRYCNVMLIICDKLEEFHKKHASLAEYKDKLLLASQDLVTKVRDLEDTGASVAYYKAALRYNSFLTQAIVQPCTQLVSIAMRVNKAVMVVCEKSLESGDDIE